MRQLVASSVKEAPSHDGGVSGEPGLALAQVGRLIAASAPPPILARPMRPVLPRLRSGNAATDGLAAVTAGKDPLSTDAAALVKQQRAFDRWEEGQLGHVVKYIPSGSGGRESDVRADVLREAVAQLDALLDETERLLAEIERSRTPPPAGLKNALTRLHQAQLVDRKHYQGLRRDQDVHEIGGWDRAALAAMIDRASTAYDHVAKDLAAAQKICTGHRDKRNPKPLHSVYIGVDAAVDALQDFVFNKGLKKNRRDRLSSTARTRGCRVLVLDRGRIAEESSEKVQVSIDIDGRGPAFIEHFHPM